MVMFTHMEWSSWASRRTWISLGSVGIAVLLAVFTFLKFQDPPPEVVALNPSDADHPYYDQFEFDSSPTVINIGTQPLYSPTGLIAEAIARDPSLTAELAEMNITVNFFPFLKGSDLNYFIRQGHIDGGFGGDMPTLAAVSDLDFTAVLLTQHGFTSVVSRVAVYGRDLRGKSIGYAEGSNAHHGLLTALKGAGVSITDVNLIAMDSINMQDAMSEGQIDAFAAWEPFTGQALLDNPDWNVVSRSFSSGYFYLSDELIRSQPMAATALTNAVFRAVETAQNQPDTGKAFANWNAETVSEIYGDAFHITGDDIWNISSSDILGSQIDPILNGKQHELLKQLESEYEFLVERGYIDSPQSWDSVRDKFSSALLGNSQFTATDAWGQ